MLKERQLFGSSGRLLGLANLQALLGLARV